MDSWIRYLHVVLNILFILVGLALVGFGIYVLVGSPTHELLVHFTKNLVMIYVTIGIGGVVFLVGACGALGSCYLHKCLLMAYLTINVIFLLAQLGVVIFVLLEKDNMKGHLSNVWQELNNETKWLLQDRFSCCGYSGPGEWNGDFPTSCLNSTILESEDPTPWQNTCYKSIVRYFDQNVILAGAIAGVIFFLEVFQIVVTCFLLRDIDDRKNSHHSAMRNNNDEFDSEGAFDEYMKNRAYEESRE